jgi:hypothetical protein
VHDNVHATLLLVFHLARLRRGRRATRHIGSCRITLQARADPLPQMLMSPSSNFARRLKLIFGVPERAADSTAEGTARVDKNAGLG